MASNRFLVQMRNIHVSHDRSPALNGIDFDLYPGEIHALIGEHRAGKSSLVKLMSGAIRKTEGTILFRGRPVTYFTPRTATQHGIGMIYQNLNVIPNLNAVKNIFAGQMLYRRLGFLEHTRMLARTTDLFRLLDLDIDPSLPVYRLALWQQYMVEFARVLMMDPCLIILDEVSNKLTPGEMKTIYRVMCEKRDAGKTVIYVTHNLDEVLRFADRVTILKNGYRGGTEIVKDLDKYRLFQLTYTYAMGERELGREERRFWTIKRYVESIVQHLPVGVAVFDPRDRVQLVNYTALDLLGTSQGQIVKKTVPEFLAASGLEGHERIAQAIHERVGACLEEVPLPEGRMAKISVSPFRDRDNRYLGTTMIVQDVSLDRKLQSYFLRSEKMASVAELAVGVAHEINNPLYIVKNYVELIRDETAEPTVRSRMDDVEKEVGRIVEIVSGLLSFSRIRDFPERRVDLVRVLNEVLLLLHHALATKHILLRKDLGLVCAEIVGDENKLKQLFLNLITNSIEAVLDEGHIGVHLRAGEDPGCVEVHVTDNGYGIPAEVQENVFKPFFSTKINKRNTGLGLSICQHIADEHGGQIGFSSVPGEETRFTVRFPLPPR